MLSSQFLELMKSLSVSDRIKLLEIHVNAAIASAQLQAKAIEVNANITISGRDFSSFNYDGSDIRRLIDSNGLDEKYIDLQIKRVLES